MNAGQEVIILLRRYLAGLLNYKGIDNSRYLEYINDSNEDKSMLAQSIQRIEERGIRKGIKKGIEKGRTEGSHENKVETARKMLQKKYPIEEIAELTGLSVLEIQNLIAP